MAEAHYRVPAKELTTYRVSRGGRFGITVEKTTTHESLLDHVLWIVIGFAIVAVSTTIPDVRIYIVGMVGGGFLAGYAFNNAVVAWRCDRVEGVTE